jgi:ABC-2 type transport system permease protein
MLFLSGQIAPLSLLPQPVQVISYALPFRWLIGFPIELVLGRLTAPQTLIGLGAQAGWLILSFAIMRTVWRAGVRVYTAVGA